MITVWGSTRLQYEIEEKLCKVWEMQQSLHSTDARYLSWRCWLS